MNTPPTAFPPAKGFSLVELMVAMGILSLLMLFLTAVLGRVQEAWVLAENRIGQFREARVAFDVMTKNIGQASLNTYWDLLDENQDGIVDGYFRTSELHFITLPADQIGASSEQQAVGHAVFFQAPLGFSSDYRNLYNLFNGRGYFAAFGSDENFRPSFVDSAQRYRYRLFEFIPPAESNQVFADGGEQRDQRQPQVFDKWFRQAMTNVGEGSFDHHLNPLAENVVALIVSPRDTLDHVGGTRADTFSRIAPRYSYDSNDASEDFNAFAQQVPPLVRVTMVVIDETSAVRLEEGPVMPELIPQGLFRNTANYDADIEALTEQFNERRINHRIFSSVVMLRSAKWSTPL